MTGKQPGRPSLYTEELVQQILERMICGESLRRICADDGMPTKQTVLNWAAAKPEFRARYEQAQELRMEYWADEIIDIADDGTNDWTELEDRQGNKRPVVDHEHIQRSRVRIDTRKWLMSKLAPKKYGDKMALTGGDGGPLTVELVQFKREDTD